MLEGISFLNEKPQENEVNTTIQDLNNKLGEIVNKKFKNVESYKNT